MGIFILEQESDAERIEKLLYIIQDPRRSNNGRKLLFHALMHAPLPRHWRLYQSKVEIEKVALG
jgi:hypothetical protein